MSSMPAGGGPPTLISVNSRISQLAHVSPIWPGDDHTTAHAKWRLWMRAAARYYRNPHNHTPVHRDFIRLNLFRWLKDMASIAVRDFVDSQVLFSDTFVEAHNADIVNFLRNTLQLEIDVVVNFLVELQLYCRELYLFVYSEDDRQSKMSTPNPAAVQALLLC